MTIDPCPASEPALIITRRFDAPRDLVFKVWTEWDHVVQWWGPKGFTTTIHEMDVRPGGVWRFIMHGPDGVDYKNRILFTEVLKPERLVFAHDDDGEGEVGFQVTVTFVAEGDKTIVTLRQLYASFAERDLAKGYALEGGNSTLDRLAEHLARI